MVSVRSLQECSSILSTASRCELTGGFMEGETKELPDLK